MKERWLRYAGDERNSDGDRFDPAVAGRRHGLPDDQALALWQRVRTDATDATGRCDERAARDAFDVLARRIADRGALRTFEVGKWSRVDVELGVGLTMPGSTGRIPRSHPAAPRG